MKKTNKKHFLGSVFVVGYISALSFVGIVGHNHPINGGIHDNCPACQWEIQAKAEDNYAKDVFEIIRNQLKLIDYILAEQIICSLQKNIASFNQERAPPSVIL